MDGRPGSHRPHAAARWPATLTVAMLLGLPGAASAQVPPVPLPEADTAQDTLSQTTDPTVPPFGSRFFRAWVGSALGSGTGFLAGALACRSGCGGGTEDPGLEARIVVGALGGAFGSAQGACAGMPAGCGRRAFVAGTLGSAAAFGATVALLPVLESSAEPAGVVVPFLVFTASQALVTAIFTR